MYVLIFKSILILMTDIFLALFIGLTAFNGNFFTSLSRANTIFDMNLYLKVLYAPIYILCIVITIILLAFDMIRASRIINSGHIAKSFTSKLAMRYYSIKGYDHYCFFKHIMKSRSFSDKIAFFVYNHFSNWKRSISYSFRLLLADGPRRILNLIALYVLYKQNTLYYVFNNFSTEWSNTQNLAIFSMILVCLSWIVNLICLLISYILLLPLFFCVIQGSVRKYVEVKIEKRLTNIISERDVMKPSDSRQIEPKLPNVQDPYLEYEKDIYPTIQLPYKSSGSLPKFKPQYQKLQPIDTNVYLNPGPQSLGMPEFMPISPVHSERPQYALPSPTTTESTSRLSGFNTFHDVARHSERSERNGNKRSLSAKNSIKRISDLSTLDRSPSPFSHFQ